MQHTAVHGSFSALDSGTHRVIAEPPPSGVRLCGAARPSAALRELANKAESLGLEPVAFELFFLAARLDETGRIDVARRELDETALEVPEGEARFYRRASRALTLGASAF